MMFLNPVSLRFESMFIFPFRDGVQSMFNVDCLASTLELSFYPIHVVFIKLINLVLLRLLVCRCSPTLI
jgi:hypothetical protein